MPWSVLLLASSIASGPTAAPVNPADQVSGDLTSYVLSYGILGVAAVVLSWLAYKGWRLMSPAREAEIRKAVRDEARADLVTQVERFERQHEQDQRDKREVGQQRDEALKYIQANLVPLLVNFTNATTALLPILQQVVQHQEGGGTSDLRRRR